MRMLRGILIASLLIAAAGVLAGARFPRQITALELTSTPQADVLVIRTQGDVPSPGAYSRDLPGATLSFLLKDVGADQVATTNLPGRLIRDVQVEPADDGTYLRIKVADAGLLEAKKFRFYQPDRDIIMLEVYDETAPLTPPAAPAVPEPPAPEPAKSAAAPNPQELGVASVDLRAADPERVLTLAAQCGLLNLKQSMRVATEGWGELNVKPAGQSLASWAAVTPPSELYLSGTPEQIADFLKQADPAAIAGLPTATEWWAANRPSPHRSVSMGTNPDTRRRLRDDPHEGLYYEGFEPGRQTLSDVLVTLPAMGGMNLYDVLDYLSLISGISIIIDPYTFEEPFGGRRPPLPPEKNPGAGEEPGFRPAGEFDPQIGGTGTVQGNIENVPFDTALELILGLHGLKYVVYYGEENTPRGSRYGSGQSSGGDAYNKPLLLVTSKERLEQELPGANQIDLYQMHYADPAQVTDMLNNLGMLPGTGTGWYIYTGGIGNNGGQGGTGGGGNNNGGGGNRGGGTGGGGRPSAFVYRGTTREPVYEQVRQAVADGANLIRVELAPDTSGQLVTMLAR